MGVRRKRREPESGEYHDPLKDYHGPTLRDRLERALVEDQIHCLKIAPFFTVAPDATVEQVMRQMVQLDIACVLIAENHRLLGVFSERDVLNKVAEQFDQVRGQPIRQFMTPHPSVVYRTDSPAKALNLMAEAGIRHVPVLDADDAVVGILGPRRLTAYLRTHLEP